MTLKFKPTRSKYDAYAAQLEEWFDEKTNLTLKEAARRLNELNPELRAEPSNLGRWWSKRLVKKNLEEWLQTIGDASRHCRRVEGEFEANPPPELDTLMKMHHSLIMSSAMKKKPDEGVLDLLTNHLRPSLQWAQVQGKKRGNDLAETRFRESLRTKMEAGFDAMAEHIRDNPEAMTALENFRKTLAGAAE